MSPRRIITIRRWEIALAFVAITVAYIIGLVLIQNQQNATRRLTVRTAKLTQELNQEVRNARQIRARQIHDLQEADVHSCHSRHTIVTALVTILEQDLHQQEHMRSLPDLTPKQKVSIRAEIRRSIIQLQGDIRIVRAADCLGVKKLPG